MPTSAKRKHRGATIATARGAKAMEKAWQLQTAKARFSEVFRLARTEGPQRITRQGKEGVVLISDEQYERLTTGARRPKSLVQFFRESPLVGVKIDWERDQAQR